MSPIGGTGAKKHDPPGIMRHLRHCVTSGPASMPKTVVSNGLCCFPGGLDRRSLRHRCVTAASPASSFRCRPLRAAAVFTVFIPYAEVEIRRVFGRPTFSTRTNRTPRLTLLKRKATLEDRDIDFRDAADVFAGNVFEFDDDRRDYGERRIITVGLLRGRMVVIGWTPRGKDCHVFSMRKANEREQKKYERHLG